MSPAVPAPVPAPAPAVRPGSGGADRTDVLVVGAGLAGLHVATRLARQGHDVLLVDRRTTLAGAIRTTGIFVRKTLDDFPLPERHLGPPIRRMLLYPPSLSRPVALVSDRDEFRVGDMAGLYETSAAVAVEAGVRLALGTRYVGRRDGTFHLIGREGPFRVRARYVVGADGARSSVARDLGLDRNRHLLVGAEEVYPVAPNGEPPTFHCVLDPGSPPDTWRGRSTTGSTPMSASPGTPTASPTACAAPWNASAPAHPGSRAYAAPARWSGAAGRYPSAGCCAASAARTDCSSGTRPARCPRSPPGGLDPCLRLSDLAAQVLDDALRTGAPTPSPTTAAPPCAPASAGGWRCAPDSRTSGRPPRPPRRSPSCAPRPAAPRRPASSSATVPSRTGRFLGRAWRAADPAAAAGPRPHARPCRPVQA